ECQNHADQCRHPRRNTSQKDRPHVSASSAGDPRTTRYGDTRPTQHPTDETNPPYSNARAMRSSVGAPGATPASTTAATPAPQTPNACTWRHAPPLTAHRSRRHMHNPRTHLDPERRRAAWIPPEHTPPLTTNRSRRHARTTPGPALTPSAAEQRGYPQS
ncbi:hypothetical protein DXG01_004640, partial [Tephrocybe rancida]